jgi:hypothetical protein
VTEIAYRGVNRPLLTAGSDLWDLSGM